MTRLPKRLFILCGVFGIWILLCILFLFRYTILQQDSLRTKSKKISWRTGSIPVLRGRLLDKHGVPLAWTEIRRDAVLERWPRSNRQKQILLQRLKKERRLEIDPSHPLPFILKQNLSPADMIYYSRLASQFPELSLRSRIMRLKAPSLTQDIPGECRTMANGIQQGISGKEKEFDLQLSGCPGRFSVMLDRRGNWISETLRIEVEGIPGKDVTLDLSIQELSEKNHDEK